MRIRALILFFSAMAAQHTASRVRSTDTAPSQHISSPDLGLSGPRGYPTVHRRDADELEDASLCFFLREKDAGESPLSCQHRLNLRSKFNYNPFGLRFGKRTGERWRRTKIFLRDLQEAS